MIYIFSIVFFIVLIIRYDIFENKKGKDFWYRFTLFSLILLAGLRYRIGGDTVAYCYLYYYEYPLLQDISWDTFFETSRAPLFDFIAAILKTIGCRFFVLQFIQALIVNGLVFRFIKKHSSCIFLCALLYYIWMYVFFTFEELPASLAVVTCLYAGDCLINKRWIWAFLLFFIAVLFHYSAIIMIIVPLLKFLKFDIKGYLFLIVSFFLVFKISESLSDYAQMIELTGLYATKIRGYSRQEMNTLSEVLRIVITVSLPYFIYLFLSISHIRNRCTNSILLKYEPFLIIGLMFVFFSLTMPIAYRFVRFFIVYFILFISDYIIYIIKLDYKGVPVYLEYSIKLLIFIPLLNIIIRQNYFVPISDSTTTNIMFAYRKYYPYYSIFSKQIDTERETIYKHLHSTQVYYYPSNNEY